MWDATFSGDAEGGHQQEARRRGDKGCRQRTGVHDRRAADREREKLRGTGCVTHPDEATLHTANREKDKIEGYKMCLRCVNRLWERNAQLIQTGPAPHKQHCLLTSHRPRKPFNRCDLQDTNCFSFVAENLFFFHMRDCDNLGT